MIYFLGGMLAAIMPSMLLVALLVWRAPLIDADSEIPA
jgi:hypothetical protein